MADKCQDTCCAGWQIAIDKKSLARYKNQPGHFGKRLRRSINWRLGTFRQTKDKRCAFLNENNLCDLYQTLEQDSLCQTCRRYPRHVEEFQNVRELTLSLSCPRAAQILLSRERPVAFRTYEKEGTENYTDFNVLLYEKLCNAREAMRGILQNRSIKIELRTALVLGLSHDIQVRILRNELEACDKVIAGYQRGRMTGLIERRQKRYPVIRKLFAALNELEQIQDAWAVQLRETEQILFGKGPQEYERLQLIFDRWLQQNMPQWEIQCEQLLVYFMDTYFCGAVYDGRAYEKMQMAVGSIWLIYEMLLARWIKNGRELDGEDIVRAVYRYSREIEHSDRNLELLEKRMRVVRPAIKQRQAEQDCTASPDNS